ncbi:MAG: hypothetical protein NVSMB55_25120 [Mycobacteriales bacterium]
MTPGGAVAYTLTVTNTGTAAAPTVTVTDSLPAGLTLVSAGGNGFTCGNGVDVLCQLAGPLPAGDSATVHVLTTLASGFVASSVTNVAVVSPTDSTPGDNVSVATTPVTVPSPVDQDLGIVKTGTPQVAAGDEIVYTLTVTNNKGTPATGFTVSDALPAGLAYTSADGAGFLCSHTGNAISCVYTGSLPVGSSADVVVRALLADNYRKSTVANTAVVTAGGSDAVPGNDSSTATTTVTPPVAAIAGGGGGGATAPTKTPITGTKTPITGTKTPITGTKAPNAAVNAPSTGGGAGSAAKPALPFTGLDAGRILQLGVSLLLLGLLLALVARRRRDQLG